MVRIGSNGLREDKELPYYLNGKANGEELLLSQPNARKCPSCEMYMHRWEDRGDLTTKLHADFGFTGEGFQVVSQKFRDIVTEVGVREVTFLPLSNGSCILRPERVTFLDLS